MDPSEVAELLRHGELSIEGQIAGSSNATLVVTVERGGLVLPAIYKPERGERPLWDFPGGLWRREVAAFELSRWFAIDLIPITVVREEGPFGVGSLQAMVDEDGVSHYFTLREEPAQASWLATLAAFDVVANNTDRKSGHVLSAPDGLWGIDHGLCFHAEPKLRTVIWDFAGTALTEPSLHALERLGAEGLPPALTELLGTDEQEATLERAEQLLDAGILPVPDDDAPWPPYPWPLV